jgi:CheY-like chemotaxis protein
MAVIMVVEDNVLNRDMLTRRLRREGFNTIFAADGTQAVEMAEISIPDLILMDMNLPTMDGWEATKRIKANEKTSGIPIIGLSAHAMSFHRERALEAGCVDYDTKPVDFQRLLDKLEPLLADR